MNELHDGTARNRCTVCHRHLVAGPSGRHGTMHACNIARNRCTFASWHLGATTLLRRLENPAARWPKLEAGPEEQFVKRHGAIASVSIARRASAELQRSYPSEHIPTGKYSLARCKYSDRAARMRLPSSAS